MDVTEKIEQVAKQVLADNSLLEKFKVDPIKIVESILGVDLPDDVIKAVIAGVTTKISADTIADVASGKTKISADTIADVAGVLKNLL